MKKLASLAVLLGLCAMPALAATANFDNVSVVDVKCSHKAAASPDSHTRSCALGCAASGYGILTKDHQFLKFDAAGNAKILKALKESHEKDHLRVNVTGDVQGDTLKVTSIHLL